MGKGSFKNFTKKFQKKIVEFLNDPFMEHKTPTAQRAGKLPIHLVFWFVQNFRAFLQNKSQNRRKNIIFLRKFLEQKTLGTDCTFGEMVALGDLIGTGEAAFFFPTMPAATKGSP